MMYSGQVNMHYSSNLLLTLWLYQEHSSHMLWLHSEPHRFPQHMDNIVRGLSHWQSYLLDMIDRLTALHCHSLYLPNIVYMMIDLVDFDMSLHYIAHRRSTHSQLYTNLHYIEYRLIDLTEPCIDHTDIECTWIDLTEAALFPMDNYSTQ